MGFPPPDDLANTRPSPPVPPKGAPESESPTLAGLPGIVPASNPRLPRIQAPKPVPRIPGYEILDQIGTGGQGEVYRACHQHLNRVVALKVLKPGADAELDLARFQREGKLAAQLEHPNFVRLYDWAEHDGQFYFSMELVDGGSLKERLQRQRRLPPLEAAELIATLADAMHHAHGKGIVHRDLKPANVLFTREGQPKIVDMGLAKKLGDDTSGLTQSRAIMGTARYMAPEQAAGKNKQVGPGTDVYSLGVILYECLTGRVPFGGEDWLDVLMQVRTEAPMPPSKIVPEVPWALEKVCLKALEKEPSWRQASARELALDLRELLDSAQAGVDLGRRPDDEDTAGGAGGDAAGEDVTRMVPAPPALVGPGGATLPAFPGYELLKEVGRSESGVVFLAEQAAPRRQVAFKVSRYSREASVRWDRLRSDPAWAEIVAHPNVVPVHEIGEFDGFLYVVMEYVETGDLNAQTTGQPLDPRAAAELLEPVARAAGVLHSRGLVHRNLKPTNVLLARRPGYTPKAPAGLPNLPAGLLPAAFDPAEWLPKITDFGLARRVSAGGPPLGDVTGMGAIVGTSLYMSPEQATGDGRDAAPSADVWSIGAMLYELLTGRTPVKAASSLEILVRLRNATEPKPPSTRQPGVPKELDAVCLKCLQPDAGVRYPDANALGDDLRTYLDGRRPSALPPDSLWGKMRSWLK